MREIKFRAWDKENKIWYKPTHEAYKNNLFELMVSFSGELLSNTMQGINHESIFPDRFDLMQFTGLYDKNGADVYEGDWIGEIGEEVIFCNECLSWQIGWTDKDGKKICHYCDGDYSFYDLVGNGIEVVGNKYENSELLK